MFLYDFEVEDERGKDKSFSSGDIYKEYNGQILYFFIKTCKIKVKYSKVNKSWERRPENETSEMLSTFHCQLNHAIVQ